MATVLERLAMLPLKTICMDINTEDKEVLRKKFIDYTNESVRSQDCNDDIGVMVYPVVWEKYEGKQFTAKTVIEEIRTDSDYLNDKPKSVLPAIYFSVAGFNGSKELQNVTEHTGLIVVDIDVKDNPDIDFNQLRKRFSLDKYVYACFRSPSGGVKVVYNTNIKDINHHKVYFHPQVQCRQLHRRLIHFSGFRLHSRLLPLPRAVEFLF